MINSETFNNPKRIEHMDKYNKLNDKIKELQFFNINNVSGMILYSDFEGITGSIWVDGNNNNVPFAYEKDGKITYDYVSLKYSLITKEWIKNHLEIRLQNIVNLLWQLDKIPTLV